MTIPACGERVGGAGTVEVRDSAGVQIVTSAGPAWEEGKGWSVEPTPTTTIGVLEGEPAYQLFGANDATRLSDGTIVVANGGTEELRFYDAGGQYLHTVGGEGGGPGEFEELSGLESVAGDAYDGELDRLSYFDATGELLRTVGVQIEGFQPRMVGTLDSALIVRNGFDPTSSFGKPTGPFRDTVAYLKVDPASGQLDTLLWLRGDARYMFMLDGGSAFAIRGVPFGATSVIAVHGGRVYTGAGDAPEIQVRDGEGALHRVMRWTAQPEPVTDDDIVAFRDAQLEGEDEDAERQEERRMLDELPIAEHFGPYRAATVDVTSALWLKAFEHLPEPAMARWRVFDADGRYLGIVRLPGRLDIVEIGDDWILGRMRDEFDVEYIVIHALDRSVEGA